MIFGIKEKCIILTIQCIVVYFYKYSCAAYDCFCAPGSHTFLFCVCCMFKTELLNYCEHYFERILI